MAVRRLTKGLLEHAIEMREAGVSVRQIAREIGCSQGALRWQFLKLAVDPPKPPPVWPDYYLKVPQINRGNHVVRAFTPDEDARLLELERQGLGDSAIGRALDRRPNSVRGRLMTLARQEERAAV